MGIHFSKRLSLERWIIHDERRNIAVAWDGKKLEQYDSDNLSRFFNGLEIKLGLEETKYQDLWKVFFNNIAIPERKNISLQAQNMPRRYWKYLVEKSILAKK